MLLASCGWLIQLSPEPDALSLNNAGFAKRFLICSFVDYFGFPLTKAPEKLFNEYYVSKRHNVRPGAVSAGGCRQKRCRS